MFVRNSDYSEYSLIKTEEIVKYPKDGKYDVIRSKILNLLDKYDIQNLQLINKKPNRVGNYIDLKILLHGQCPKVELWKLNSSDELEYEDMSNELKISDSDLERLEKKILIMNLRKLFAIKIYSKPQLMRRNVVYSLNGIKKTQLHRVINEIRILQDLSEHDPNKYYIVRLHQVLESNKNNLNSGKFYLIYDLYPLGPTMGPYSRYDYWNDVSDKSGTLILIQNDDNLVDNSGDSELNSSLKNVNKLVYIPNPKLRQIGENEIKHFVYCVATALSKLHELGIAHRDVKPDNLLLSENGDIVLIDFNSAEYLIDGKYVSGTEGTYAFFPPEYCKLSFNSDEEGSDCNIGMELNQVRNDNKDDYYETNASKLLGRPADMWALGVTIWCWLFKELPFQGNNILDLFSSIAKCELVIPSNSNFSNEGKDVILNLLNPDPNFRWTARQLLESKWLNDDIKQK
ncbi:kinase [Cryptosporidium bovis]|uniref:kinase n=1 Tax=Cryptosporidium bovis TaxID=310047 RepID=UPI003519ECE0|nr:kinase [Cryptosporidium bovis]